MLPTTKTFGAFFSFRPLDQATGSDKRANVDNRFAGLFDLHKNLHIKLP